MMGNFTTGIQKLFYGVFWSQNTIMRRMMKHKIGSKEYTKMNNELNIQNEEISANETDKIENWKEYF